MRAWLWPLLFLMLGGCNAFGGASGLTEAPLQDDFAQVERPDAPVVMASDIGTALNPAATAPGGRFRAFYYDRNAPGTVVASETVSHIAIKYPWSDFHGIDSGRFGGYWVGRLHFDAATTQDISVSLSWSHAKIIVDGRTVFDGKDSTTFPHDFPAGDSLIEVEFENSWHTTEFKVTFQDPAITQHADAAGIAATLRGSRFQGADVNYVGIYESKSRDTSMSVVVPADQRSPVLWLTSYEAVEWHVRSASEIPLVVVSSYAPGSRVHGIPPDRVVYLDTRDAVPSISSAGRRCTCVGSSFHCESGADIARVAAQLEDLTGLKLTGYALAYDPATLTVAPWTQAVADAATQGDDAARQQCPGATDMSAPPQSSGPARPRDPQPGWRFGQPVTNGR